MKREHDTEVQSLRAQLTARDAEVDVWKARAKNAAEQAAKIRAKCAALTAENESERERRVLYEGQYIAAHNKLMRAPLNYDPLNIVTTGIGDLQAEVEGLREAVTKAETDLKEYKQHRALSHIGEIAAVAKESVDLVERLNAAVKVLGAAVKAAREGWTRAAKEGYLDCSDGGYPEWMHELDRQLEKALAAAAVKGQP